MSRWQMGINVGARSEERGLVFGDAVGIAEAEKISSRGVT